MDVKFDEYVIKRRERLRIERAFFNVIYYSLDCLSSLAFFQKFQGYCDEFLQTQDDSVITNDLHCPELGELISTMW